LRVAVAALVAVVLATAALAQWRGFSSGTRPPPPPPSFAEQPPPPGFSFCRLYYVDVRDEEYGQKWWTDYPTSDANLMLRLSQVTNTQIRTDTYGDPDFVVVSATDPELSNHPFLFMSDAGTVGWSEPEATALRDYLLKGGFLWADDFWGDAAWRHFSREIDKVLPAYEYPIVDVPTDHYLFRILFELPGVPQVPSIQFWSQWGGTSERGAESAEPHLRAIFDPSGRPMVLMSHNTDIADGWEREGESDEFFELFSVPASYPLGINIVLHSLVF
jgi:hypothetical protein